MNFFTRDYFTTTLAFTISWFEVYIVAKDLLLTWDSKDYLNSTGVKFYTLSHNLSFCLVLMISFSYILSFSILDLLSGKIVSIFSLKLFIGEAYFGSTV